MPNWKKIIVSGSSASLQSLNVTDGITGSLDGNSSTSTSSSYALSASYLIGAVDPFPYIGDAQITGSLIVSGSGGLTVLSGSVGIGTSSPASELHVAKSTDGGNVEIILENSFTNAGSSTDESTQIQGRFGGYDASYIITGKEGDYTTAALRKSYLAFSTRTATTGMTEKVRIDSSGNVGIGTNPYPLDFPNSKLHVYGTRSNTVDSANAIAKIGGSDVYISFGALNGTPNYGAWIQALRPSDNAVFPLSLNSQGGNVLIGTTTDAGYKLDVNGTGRFSSTVQMANGSQVMGGGIFKCGIASGNAGAALQLLGWTTGGAYSNWQIDTAHINAGFNITPSSTGGGSTFTTPALTILTSGAATFSSTVQANGAFRQYIAAGYYADFAYNGTTYNLGSSEAEDNIDFKIAGGGTFTTGGKFRWFTQAGGGTPIERFTIASTGEATFGAANTETIGNLNLNGGIGDSSTYDVIQTLSRTSSTGNVLAAQIALTAPSTYQQNLVFRIKTTASAGNSAGYFTDALTIASTGAATFSGTTEPQVTITDGTNSLIELRSSANAASINFHRQQTGGTQANIGMSVPGSSGLVDDLVFAMNNGTSWSERMRITSGGDILVGATSFPAGERMMIQKAEAASLGLDRLGSDGGILRFYQDGAEEGNVTISGTTVSYNGGHLSRWSQTESNERIEGLVKGTVMSNLDQMAVWINPETGEPYENEQLNCIKISDIEGDKNVAGVFVNWDNDDQIYTNDINIAMTGDMIIRIAEGIVVEKGDLLISAGDGTAKPQSDDLIRSNTIAKVTSNHVTCVYEDGSYCVPCVLMAC